MKEKALRMARGSNTQMKLCLYTAGDGPNSGQAKFNIQRLRREYLQDCEIEFVDILENPLRALKDGIRLSPTLLRVTPGPPICIVGNLQDQDTVLMLLGIAGIAS